MSKLDYIKAFLNDSDIKFLVVTTAVGCVIQVGCRRYMKNHPEIFKDINSSPHDDTKPKIFSPRGGEFIITGASTAAVLNTLIAFLGKHGITSAIIAGISGRAARKINLKALSRIIRRSSPQNSPYPALTSEDVESPLSTCDDSMKYLLDLIADSDLPFKEKLSMSKRILMHYLNLNNTRGRIAFVVACTVSVFLVLNGQPGNVHIFMRSIIEAVREGSITKPVARSIVRRLMKNNVPIDPELLDIINDDPPGS